MLVNDTEDVEVELDHVLWPTNVTPVTLGSLATLELANVITAKYASSTRGHTE
jgi:hypothetical protein